MQSRSVRLISIMICLTITWFGLSITDPAWAQSIGIDIWNVDSLLSQKEQCDLRFMELDQCGERAMARYHLNQMMVEELIAGRRELFDVADQMYQDNSSYPGYCHVIDNFPKEMSLTQRTVEHILLRTRHTLYKRADTEQVMGHLKTEYVKKFGMQPLNK